VVEWVIVVNFFHDFILILGNSFFVGLIASDLIWKHLLFLLISQLLHLVVDILLHLAVVNVEEVVSSLHSSVSSLLWMTEIEIALRIVEERVLATLQKLTSGEVTLWARDLLTDQALDVMLLTTFDSIHLHLKALHTSHSMLALIGGLPSSMQFIVLKVEVLPLAHGVLQ